MNKNIEKLKGIEKEIYLLGFENWVMYASEIKDTQKFRELKKQVRETGGFVATVHKIGHHINNRKIENDNRLSVSSAELMKGHKDGGNFICRMAQYLFHFHNKNRELTPSEYRPDYMDLIEGWMSPKLAKGLHEILSNIKRVENRFKFNNPEKNTQHPSGKDFDGLENYLKTYNKNDPYNRPVDAIFGKLDKNSADRIETLLKNITEQLSSISKGEGVGVKQFHREVSVDGLVDL